MLVYDYVCIVYEPLSVRHLHKWFDCSCDRSIGLSESLTEQNIVCIMHKLEGNALCVCSVSLFNSLYVF